MTLSITASACTYTGNGSTVAFDVKSGSDGIYFETSAELYVTIRVGETVTPQTLNTDYTVAGAGSAAGVVTFGTAPASGVEVRIERRTPLTQTLALSNSGAFNPANVMGALDKLTRIAQDAARGSGGGSESGTYDGIPLTRDPSGEAWDGDDKRLSDLGDPTEAQDAVTRAYGDAHYGGTAAAEAEDSAVAAAGSAAAAATSADEAEASAGEAAASAEALATNYVQPSSTVLYEHVVLDSLDAAFNGSAVTFDLELGGSAFTPANAPQLLVVFNGVSQAPGTTYTVTGSQITFTSAPVAGDSAVIVAMKTAAGVVDIVATAYMQGLIETIGTAASLRVETGTRTSALDSLDASFNGSTTVFDLTASASAFTPRDVYGIGCVFNGVLQVPGAAYTVSGSQITFTFTPNSGDSATLWAISA